MRGDVKVRHTRALKRRLVRKSVPTLVLRIEVENVPRSSRTRTRDWKSGVVTRTTTCLTLVSVHSSFRREVFVTGVFNNKTT